MQLNNCLNKKHTGAFCSCISSVLCSVEPWEPGSHEKSLLSYLKKKKKKPQATHVPWHILLWLSTFKATCMETNMSF